jgi:exodeoxyribonuclease VII large subunit
MTDNHKNFSHEEASGDNRPTFSVSEISQALKKSVEENFSYVRVRGEISRFTLARSGHMYMTMKDENSVLDAICWKGTSSRLSIIPEDGMEVIATGRLTTYPGRSNYQIVIEQLEVAGQGALLKLLEDRRRKLLAEGLFDSELKKELPYLPECIGVVTSPTGAVIRDILHRLDDRFPRHVLLWPANVQGDGAAGQIVKGIEGFNNIKKGGKLPRPDLLIIARGGGSLEDLWAFNEETVVRAAANSDIPLISAIGHETDITLIDFVSDKRAPTPSAAAEMAVPVRTDLIETLATLGVRLNRAINRSYADNRRDVEGLIKGLANPSRIAEEATQRLDDCFGRLISAKDTYYKDLSSRILQLSAGLISPAQYIILKQTEFSSQARAWLRSISVFVEKKSHNFDIAALKLEGVSFQRVLDRGFALVTDHQGKPVLSATSTKPGMSIGIRFNDGDVNGTISSKSELKVNKNKSSGNQSKSKENEPQGSLL